MAVPFVPFPLLLRLAHPDGQRLEKRTAFVPPKPVSQFTTYPPSHVASTRPLLEGEADNVGNLPNEEYRFWQGRVAITDRTSICRGCSMWKYDKAGRQEHHNASDCKEILLAAYRKLNATNTCAVCGKHQPGYRMWGVPLCAGCLDPWKYLAPRTASPLSAAITTVRGELKAAK